MISKISSGVRDKHSVVSRYQRIIADPDAISALERSEVEDLLSKVEKLLELEPKLIELGSGRTVFVGDTHGDFQASKSIIAKHLKAENSNIVFLGDYVDRGPQSAENINYLLALKLLHPQNLFLLMGNHEAHGVMRFYPADFWQRLDPGLYQRYATVLTSLPLAVATANGIIALHGALPDVESLQEINRIDTSSEAWRQMTWGDWQERGGGSLGDDAFTGRPQFGKDYFDRVMDRLGKNLLIRSHQPTAPQAMYQGRCLTIFTSHAYVPTRTIAIVDLTKEVKTIDDIAIEVV